MDDIEELAIETNTVHISQGAILPRRKRENINPNVPDVQSGCSIPGTQKVWIKTYGCSHNVSDSEYMEGILSTYGYQIVSEQEQADLWLVNSSTP
jgi:threonylcarbamoyladenosine tRNA methylthiotransferase CDKAL1